jgi:hypothetical protein
MGLVTLVPLARNKAWDAFISHATEDKRSVAEPLARLLTSAGLDIWLDKYQLRVGDSLREKIDEGLAQSRHGVVVLSKAFFSKRWPRDELNALFAIGADRILPVWHKVSAKDVAAFSPLLADRLALQTSEGLETIAASIAGRVITDSGSPSYRRSNRLRLLSNLLDRGSASEVDEFLRFHPSIIRAAFVKGGYFVVEHKKLARFHVNFAIAQKKNTAARVEWHVVFLRGPTSSILGKQGRVSQDLASAFQEIKHLQDWLTNTNNQKLIQQKLSDIGPDFSSTVIIGRRRTIGKPERAALERHSLGRTSIRTYDFLLESTASSREWQNAFCTQHYD